MRSIFIHDNNLSSYIVGFMEIVQDNKSLKILCKDLEKQKIIYMDTEFLRDRTYWPLLCTIQIQTQKKCYLIDMLSNKEMNFNMFIEIIKNKNILKVIHSARQDIEVLFCKFNFIVWPIFKKIQDLNWSRKNCIINHKTFKGTSWKN